MITFIKNLKKYMKNTRITEELKYQSIDSTFIEDINGSKSAFYNKIYKRRKGEASKGIKISSLVTTKGIPISISIDGGNKYDSFGIRYALFLRSKNMQSTPNASKANNYSKAVIISLEHHYFLKLLIIVLLIPKQKNICIIIAINNIF